MKNDSILDIFYKSITYAAKENELSYYLSPLIVVTV